jgi:hypothetical protein
MLFTTLILLGCDTQRFTTKFEVTPTMEDSVTTPEKLTKELEEELKLEDAKRIKVLQEEAEKKKEKKGKPAGKKAEETKGVETKIKP